MTPRRLLSYLTSFAITAIFLALALANVKFDQLQDAFTQADYRLVLFASCFTLAGYAFRTARWRQLLVPSQPVPLARLFPILVIGFALNNLLPGRPGELLRAHALGKRENMSRILGFGTVVLERVADGITLIATLLIAFLAFRLFNLELPILAEWIALVAFVLFAVAQAAMLFLLKRESLALRVFKQFTRSRSVPRGIAARLERMLGSFVLGLHSLHSTRDVVAIAVLSLAVWGCEFISYFVMLTAFHALPALTLRPVAAAFMMVLINLGIMIPAAPGGLGPYEAAGVFALGAFGVNETSAASVALATHAMQYVLITLLGGVFVWREGISLAQATDAENG